MDDEDCRLPPRRGARAAVGCARQRADGSNDRGPGLDRALTISSPFNHSGISQLGRLAAAAGVAAAMFGHRGGEGWETWAIALLAAAGAAGLVTAGLPT